MSNLYPYARNGSLKYSFTCNLFFTKKWYSVLFQTGVTQQRDTPQSLDIYQITAADMFFPAMHITQFLKLPTSDSFSQSGSHICTPSTARDPKCERTWKGPKKHTCGIH